MIAEELFLFVTASFLLAITPGPTILLTLFHVQANGSKSATTFVAGTGLANLSIVVLVALGLGSAFIQLPGALEALRWLGVLYLLYLGFKYWQQSVPADDAAMSATGRWEVFRQAVLISWTNPKSLLFYLLVLPQFLPFNDAPVIELAILGFLHVAILIAVLAASIAVSGQFRRTLTSDTTQRYLDRFTGGVLWIAAALLVFGDLDSASEGSANEGHSSEPLEEPGLKGG